MIEGKRKPEFGLENKVEEVAQKVEQNYKDIQNGREMMRKLEHLYKRFNIQTIRFA